jgi:group I intron endonuclease
MFHYIYRTTCVVTNRFYLGVHSTKNLNDGYFGSGLILKRSINKYGAQNHKIEFLEYFACREDALARERELVTMNLISEKLCMNIRPGGSGGFGEENAKRTHQQLANQASQASQRRLYDNDPEWSQRRASRISESLKKAYEDGSRQVCDHLRTAFTGKQHSDEAKKKMSEKAKLRKTNSQTGTIWITNDLENCKIPGNETLPVGWRRGRKL